MYMHNKALHTTLHVIVVHGKILSFFLSWTARSALLHDIITYNVNGRHITLYTQSARRGRRIYWPTILPVFGVGKMRRTHWRVDNHCLSMVVFMRTSHNNAQLIGLHERTAHLLSAPYVLALRITALLATLSSAMVCSGLVFDEWGGAFPVNIFPKFRNFSLSVLFY